MINGILNISPLYVGGAFITERWLRDNGFRILAREDRQPTDHYRRLIGHELKGGRPFMGSSDDLCIELARHVATNATNGGPWHCWIVQIEPQRHIHIRDMETTWEVISLYEGLTGMQWKECGAMGTGS